MLWKVIITALSGPSDVIDDLSLSGKYTCTHIPKLLVSGSSRQWNIVWEIFWTWMKGRVVNDIPSRANLQCLSIGYHLCEGSLSLAFWCHFMSVWITLVTLFLAECYVLDSYIFIFHFPSPSFFKCAASILRQLMNQKSH